MSTAKNIKLILFLASVENVHSFDIMKNIWKKCLEIIQFLGIAILYVKNVIYLFSNYSNNRNCQ